mgnify:CR=1 FL=1
MSCALRSTGSARGSSPVSARARISNASTSADSRSDSSTTDSSTSMEKSGAAAETTVDSGAFATTMPRLVAASTSTLSTPMPARPITFSRVAFSMIFAVALVAERIASPS